MIIKTFIVDEIRFQAVWSSCSIPSRLSHATLANYQPDGAEKEAALHKCRTFAENGLDNISRGRGLFLQGPVGTGKSHLSVAVLREIILNNPERFGTPPSLSDFYDEYAYEGYRCSMVSVVELLESLRDAIGSAKKKEAVRCKLYRIKCDDFIILDDIGAERPSEFAAEQLFIIIDLRYRTKRSTFFTSNCTLKELEDLIGERSVSRIFEMCEGVRVSGEDWRKKRLDR
jgi:DNA replication protein DnaC